MLLRVRSLAILWLALFCTAALPLLFPAPFGALAQGGHTHAWQVEPSYFPPMPYLAGYTQPRTGQLVPVYAYFGSGGQDYDQCTGNTDYYHGVSCSFGSYGMAQASNTVKIVEWSASRSGGKFGWMNGSSQFVEKGPNDPWSQVTHYQTPATTGDVTLTVSVEDDPHATDPATQQVVQTAFDGRKSGSTTITVTTDPTKPTWAPHTGITGAAMSQPTTGAAVQTGQTVTCSAATATDADQKDPPQQMFYYGMSGQTEYPDDTLTYSWTATGGTFQNATAQNTSWSCNTPGNYTLTLRVDDQNDANKPSGDNGTRDDAAVVLTRTVQVSAPSTNWNTYSAISSGITIPMADLTVALGASVPLEALSASDTDQRVANSGTTLDADSCTYAWSASPNGGSFTTTNQRTTTWTAPNAAGSYTLTLTVDDQNDANKPAGELGTRNDAPQTYTRTVHVYNASWAADTVISGVTLLSPSAGVTAARGAQIACSAADGAADNDRRTPLGGTATTVADTVHYTWLASGGSFAGGVTNGLNVTWVAPNQAGTYTVTLRVDDENDTNKPSDEGGTRNDPPVDRTVNVVVKAPQWTPGSGISSDGITEPVGTMITVDPHQVVLCATNEAADKDQRTDENGSSTLYDDVVNYAWSATGGSFVSATSRNASWTAPADAGTYTLTLKLADAAVKNPEGEGSRDDPDRTFTVTVKVRHFHQWTTAPATTPFSFSVSELRPLPGQAVLLFKNTDGADSDTCTAAGCSFPEGKATNAVQTTQWLASSGTFGYFSGTTWIPSTNAAQITHWKAPATPGWATLRLRTDDTPSATDPETNQSVTTADDATAEATYQLKVVSHRHTWTDGDPITAPAPTVSQAYPLAGEVVQLTAQPGTDHDTCTAEGCSFSGGIAANNTYPATWSCTAGEFVQLDPATGTYVPYVGSNPPSGAQVAWRAPQSIPYGGLNVTVTLAVEDVAAAYDTEYESDVRTADDAPATVVASITVVRHRHQWEAVNNLSVGDFSVETQTPVAGQTIQVNAGYGYSGYGGYYGSGGGYDDDHCVAADCPFYYGHAYNNTHIVSWEAKANGADVGTFGWIGGNGQFVAKQASDPWTQVTHWKAPPTVPAGGLSVTLTLKADDTPEATDPELNEVVPTYDDAPASASKTLTVTRHQHAWGAYYDAGIPQPSISVSNYNPAAGAVIQLIRSVATREYDSCYDYQNTCPFSNDQAENEVRITSWGDHDAGGKFGRLVDGQFVERGANDSWDTVTHYRCPATEGYLTLTLTVDDVWQGIIEPVTGDSINTYDDDPATADQYLEVRGCNHTWQVDPSIPAPVLVIGEGAMSPGSVVPITVSWNREEEDCVIGRESGGNPCGHDGIHVTNRVTLHLDDGNAGGTFGKLVNGTFQSCPDEDATCYQAGDGAEGTITLHATLDDTPAGTDPASQMTVSTADDEAVEGQQQVTVRPIFLDLFGPADFLPIPASTPEGSWPAGDGAKTAQVNGIFVVHPGDAAITATERQQLTDSTKVKVQLKVEASKHVGEDSTAISPLPEGPDLTLHSFELNKVDLELVVRQVDGNLLLAEPAGEDSNGDGQAGAIGAILFARDMRALGKVTASTVGFVAHTRYRHPGVSDPTAALDFTGASDAEGRPNALVIPMPCPGANVTNVNAHQVPRVWWNRERSAATMEGVTLPDRPANADTNDLEQQGPHQAPGDGYSVWMEYGGYPESSSGSGGWIDGRRRLSVLRKEMLLLISIMQQAPNVNQPIISADQAVAAVNAAKDAFAAAGVEVYWAWNCAVVSGHDRAFRDGKAVQPAWATFGMPANLLGIRTIISKYRTNGMRGVIFGSTAQAAMVGSLLNEYGHAPLESGARDGAVILEGMMRAQLPPTQIQSMRHFTLVHELGHCMGIKHLLVTNGPWRRLEVLQPNDAHPTLVYSHLIMWNGFWPAVGLVVWPSSPTGGALRKANRQDAVFFNGDDGFQGGEVGLFSVSGWKVIL